MALIVCKNCGKKISDSAEKCIHCGISMEEALNGIQEKCEEKSNVEAQNAQAEKRPDYFSYDEADRLKFEKEFLKNDKWAKKFRRRGLETEKFKSLFFNVMLSFLALQLLCIHLYNNVFNKVIYDELALGISACILIGLLLVSFVLIIVTCIMGIVHKRSIKKYIYIKKYQRWLLENKKVSYTPLFFELSEKAIFDKVDLEKINF